MSEEILQRGDLVFFSPHSFWGEQAFRTHHENESYKYPGIIVDEWEGEELDFYGGPHQRKVFLVYWSNGMYSREYDCYLKKISSEFGGGAAATSSNTETKTK